VLIPTCIPDINTNCLALSFDVIGLRDPELDVVEWRHAHLDLIYSPSKVHKVVQG